MHVLLIHQVFVRPQDPGGTRHYEFAQMLADSGHRVTVLAGSRSYLTGEHINAPPHEWVHDGVQVVRCGVWGPVGRSFFWRAVGFLSFMLTAFLRAVRVRDVDLVWGTSPPLFQVITSWAVARLKGVPWLFEVRDLWPAFAVQAGVVRNRMLVGLAEAAERFLYARADHLVINSPGFRSHLEAKGAPADAISLVANGVNVAQFKPDAAEAGMLRQHGLEDRFVALYSGAHGRANNLSLVMEAALRLKENPGIVFLLVGDGPEKRSLMQRAEQLGLRNVKFLPPVPKADMPGLLGGVDCGIAVLQPIPLFRTTYPNKVFDYMAAGKPVVLAIEGAIQEVVEGARAGISVPPDDGAALAEAVHRLAQDPGLARAMGLRGRECVESGFDRTLLFGQFKRVLEGMLDELV